MQFVRFGNYDQAGKFQERLGTGSYFQIDGRLSSVNAHQSAVDECLRRGFTGFQYYQGASILDAKPVASPADCRYATKG